MIRHLGLASLSLLLLAGCSASDLPLTDGGSTTADAGNDAGTCDPSTASQTACCQGGCNNDVLVDPICVDGAWTCAPGDKSEAECGTQLPFCQLSGAPASSLKPCVDHDAGMCVGGCDPGEICFTQTSCGPLPDGGSQCGAGATGEGDDRCHRLCGGQTACGAGESCDSVTFFGCADFDAPKQLCR